MKARVLDILIATNPGEKLNSNNHASLVPGKGIRGDRYFEETGTFSDKLKGLPDKEVTLIEIEEINNFNSLTGLNYEPGMFRRNILTEGIRLNELEGHTFSIGEVKLEGIRLCEPCAYLSTLLGQEVLNHMINKAGLRARVVNEGDIRVGDIISV